MFIGHQHSVKKYLLLCSAIKRVKIADFIFFKERSLKIRI